MISQEFHFDYWGVDCAVASSQKGFLLPPGLSFVALSDKAKYPYTFETTKILLGLS